MKFKKIIILALSSMLSFPATVTLGADLDPPPRGDRERRDPPMDGEKSPPPFLNDDALLKRAFESDNEEIKTFVMKQMKKGKGPSALKEDFFRAELEKKLDAHDAKNEASTTPIKQIVEKKSASKKEAAVHLALLKKEPIQKDITKWRATARAEIRERVESALDSATRKIDLMQCPRNGKSPHLRENIASDLESELELEFGLEGDKEIELLVRRSVRGLKGDIEDALVEKKETCEAKEERKNNSKNKEMARLHDIPEKDCIDCQSRKKGNEKSGWDIAADVVKAVGPSALATFASTYATSKYSSNYRTYMNNCTTLGITCSPPTSNSYNTAGLYSSILGAGNYNMLGGFGSYNSLGMMSTMGMGGFGSYNSLGMMGGLYGYGMGYNMYGYSSSFYPNYYYRPTYNYTSSGLGYPAYSVGSSLGYPAYSSTTSSNNGYTRY